MYSTTTLAKNSKLTGKLVGTHQQLDQAARKLLAKHLPRGRYFPNIKEIRHFSGALGPDGLKRKSPDDDDPSHMFDGENGTALVQQIMDHHYNLVQALKNHNEVRAAFEAAWLAHKVTDALTPAHHFPLSEAKEELMSNKEFVKIFGEPIKGIMHGRNAIETARNNWLYWGAGGYFSKHMAYEYGVVIIAATLPQRKIMPEVGKAEFQYVDAKKTLFEAIDRIQPAKIYDNFRKNGWTTELALETKKLVLPEMVRAEALIWYSAAEEAYGLHKPKKTAKKATKGDQSARKK
mgnify:FL=1